MLRDDCNQFFDLLNVFFNETTNLTEKRAARTVALALVGMMFVLPKSEPKAKKSPIELNEAEKRLCRDNATRIPAIKAVRDRLGIGLREAIDLVDTYRNTYLKP